MMVQILFFSFSLRPRFFIDQTLFLSLIEVIGWPDFLEPFALLEVIDWPDSLFKPLASVELILQFFYFFWRKSFRISTIFFGCDDFQNLIPGIPKCRILTRWRHYLDAIFSAQELSNESHIVWFRRLLKFNPPLSRMPNGTFLPKVSLNFFLKSLFYIFSVFLSPWSFDWAPFRLSRAIFRILTT